eukprot:1186614-Prorocentrum_minimum.AAC.3
MSVTSPTSPSPSLSPVATPLEAGQFTAEAGQFTAEAGQFTAEAGQFTAEAGQFTAEAGDPLRPSARSPLSATRGSVAPLPPSHPLSVTFTPAAAPSLALDASPPGAVPLGAGKPRGEPGSPGSPRVPWRAALPSPSTPPPPPPPPPRLVMRPASIPSDDPTTLARLSALAPLSATSGAGAPDRSRVIRPGARGGRSRRSCGGGRGGELPSLAGGRGGRGGGGSGDICGGGRGAEPPPPRPCGRRAGGDADHLAGAARAVIGRLVGGAALIGRGLLIRGGGGVGRGRDAGWDAAAGGGGVMRAGGARVGAAIADHLHVRGGGRAGLGLGLLLEGFARARDG